MTARRLYVPAAMPSRDANGRALPAKLRFYTPGAAYDTLATVYTSSALTTAHAQPVLSNAYGHFPEIWADSTSSFDVAYSDQVFDRRLGAWEAVTPLTDATTGSVALAESAEIAAEDAQAAAEAAQALAEAAATAASAALGGLANVSNPLTPQNFGAAGNGVANDTAAFLLWAAQLGPGIEGYVPPGTYNLASATLGVSGLALAAGSKIRGSGSASKIVVTGSAECNVFVASDASNIAVESVWLYGNNVSSSFGTGYAISYTLSTGATADISGLRVTGCRLDNFKGDYWISVVNLNTNSHTISDVRITGNSFYSYSGNSRGPTNLGVNSANILLNGYASIIKDAWITDNYSDANWIKSFCIVFSRAQDIHIERNTVDNSGVGASAADKGAYAVLIYNDSGETKRIYADKNILNAPFSAGIYAAGVKDCAFSGNNISGQADTASGTIPKAGIIAVGENIEITGGSFRGNYCDIVAEGPLAGGEANISITGIRSSGGSGQASIRAIPQVGVNWSGLTITGCNIKHATKGITFNASAALAITDITISGNRIEAPYGIDLNDRDVASVLLSAAVITGNRIKATSYGVYAYYTVGVSVLGNQIEGLMSGAHVYGASSTSFFAQGNTHKGQSSGNTYNLAAATGGVWGNNFWDCLLPTAAGATMLGYQRPSFSGYLGLMVQNLNVSDAGGAGKTYTVQGWICTGTTNWYDLRAPDQNNSATA